MEVINIPCMIAVVAIDTLSIDEPQMFSGTLNPATTRLDHSSSIV